MNEHWNPIFDGTWYQGSSSLPFFFSFFFFFFFLFLLLFFFFTFDQDVGRINGPGSRPCDADKKHGKLSLPPRARNPPDLGSGTLHLGSGQDGTTGDSKG